MIDFLMFFGIALLFIALPTSIILTIVFTVKKNKKVIFSAVGIPVSFILSLTFLGVGGYLYGQTDEYKEQMAQQEIERQEREELERIEAEQKAKEEQASKKKELAQKEEELKKREEALEIKEKENAKKEKTTVEPTVKPTEIPVTKMPEESVLVAFYEILILNSSNYVGKSVETTIIVSNCTNLKDEYYISSTLNANYDDIKIYTESENNYESGEYLTVEGTINIEDGSGVVMKNTNIVATGSIAKEKWNNQLHDYIEKFAQIAENPTYDDLMRYPDSYSGKEMIIHATITDVEPDGIIFNGKIQATVDGKQVLLEDSREVREPRLQEGDAVTIYGFGAGLATVKEYDKSGIIPKEIDKYNIPQVNIRHIEF